jgi:hypothetical protein
MKNRTFAYMAGLMDTDGTLGIYYKGQSGYQASVEFYNDDKFLMDWVVSKFGGTYSIKKDPRREVVGYRWKPSGKQHVINFLNDIFPYLVLKRTEARCIIDFYNLSGECPDKRNALMLECRAEKGKRGIVETDTLRALLKESPKLTRAYIAGLLDGDGNIDTYDKQVVIGFTNMSTGLIEFLQDSVGGNAYKCKPTTWRWQLSGVKIQELFLLSILPYLVSKREKAKIAVTRIREIISTVKIKGRPFNKAVIQSELIGDYESELMETLVS